MCFQLTLHCWVRVVVLAVMFVTRLHLTAVKAVAVSPGGTKVGRVTQTLLLLCEAQGNMEDASITFTWVKGNEVVQKHDVATVSGRAASVLTVDNLSVDEHHGKTIQCHPSNNVGGANVTSFVISVQTFPPPVIVSFRFDPDNPDMVIASWNPVNVTHYPNASLDGYVFEIAKDENGSEIVTNGTVAASNFSFIFSLTDKFSDGYWVRIKAVKDNQDVSGFSKWFPIETVPSPTPVGECAGCWEGHGCVITCGVL